MMTQKIEMTRPAEEEIDLAQLLARLLDGRWWILSLTALFAAIGIAYALLATPIYRANTLLQIEKSSKGSALLGEMADLLENGQPDTEAEIELLSSRMVLGKTVQALRLTDSAEPKYLPLIGQGLSRLQGKPVPHMVLGAFDVDDALRDRALLLTFVGADHFVLEGEGRHLEGEIGKVLEQDGITLLVKEVKATAGQRFVLTKRSELEVIGELQQTLQIKEKGKNSGILMLTLEGRHPLQSRQVLDSISQHYLHQDVMRRTEEAQRSLDFLEQQLPQIKGELSRAEEQLNVYRQQNDSVDLSLEAKAALDGMVDLEKQLNELTFREAELQQRFTRQHPAYVALLEKRQTLLKAKGQINRSIRQLPKTQQEILRLTRDTQVSHAIYVQLLNKRQELGILKAGTVSKVRIVDPAVVEPLPVKPKKPLIVVLATLLGGMLGVGVVLLRCVLHRGIESPEQLEAMGLSVYATVPFTAEQSTIVQRRNRRQVLQLSDSLLALKNPADLAMEALRSLRTSLHFAMFEASNNIVMISGPGPGLGKTFISVNFAATLAMGGKRVLLIDADLRKGYLQKVMCQPMGVGLSDYLGGMTAHPADAALVRPSGFEGLDFISRGELAPNPSELLMHPRFATLLEWAATQYDVVLLDAPPILAVTDAAIIAQQAGTTFLVARYRVTEVKEMEVAIRRFAQNGVTIKGVLLNAIERQAGNVYGYYQYSYETSA